MINYTSACYETTNTTLTGTIAAKANSWVLATVTTRSATTFPAGWTVLRESHVLPSGDGSNQRMAFLCKKIETDGTVSCAVTQAESARIYLNLIAFENIAGFQYNSGSEAYSDTKVTVSELQVPKRKHSLLVWGCTAPTWLSSVPHGTWTSPAAEPICLDQATTAPRQANFVDVDANSTHTAFSGPKVEGGTCYIIDCVEILVDRYSAPAEWFESMADEIRRLTETTEGKDTDTMLSDLQGLTIPEDTGGGGYYPGEGDGTSYPDAETASYGDFTEQNGFSETSSTASFLTGGGLAIGYEFTANKDMLLAGFRFKANADRGTVFFHLCDMDSNAEIFRLEVNSYDKTSVWADYRLQSFVGLTKGKKYFVAASCSENTQIMSATVGRTWNTDILTYSKNMQCAVDKLPWGWNYATSYHSPIDIIVMPHIPESTPTEYKVQLGTLNALAKEVSRITGTPTPLTVPDMINELRLVPAIT